VIKEDRKKTRPQQNQPTHVATNPKPVSAEICDTNNTKK